MQVKINHPQYEFLNMVQKYRAFVGGYGSSKTFCISISLCQHFYLFPQIDAGYFAPTYTQIRDIFFPTIEEVAYLNGFDVDIKDGAKEVHFYCGQSYYGKIRCRSMKDPGSIVGFKIGHAAVDELDTLLARNAQEAWRKIIARMRYKGENIRNGVDVATTPEGFKFTYKTFEEDLQERPELKQRYGMVQASTYDNAANLPDDYIPSLLEAYPEELIKAYLHGQFVNLTTGTVYKSYDRIKNRSSESIQDGEALHVGMDFNVTNMAAKVYVIRKNGWHMVAELKKIFDTPEMIEVIKEKYQSRGHLIHVYPDASGDSRKSVDASKSDIGLLEGASFIVWANPKNPFIKDRVMSVNKQFEIKNLWVNDNLCPSASKCLEQQTYDGNGEPDKQGGFDHDNDAMGYPMAYMFPIVRPVIDAPINFVF